jgi:iron complex transport system substrate-binding protein
MKPAMPQARQTGPADPRWRFGLHGLCVALALLTGVGGVHAQVSLGWQKPGEFSVQSGPEAYPRRFTDAQGAMLVLPAAPRRIVSLEFETDNYAYLIADPAHIVGVNENAYNVQVSNVLPLVQAHRPAVAANVEVILRLKPDLVLAADRTKAELVHALQAAGVPVFRLYTLVTRLDQVAGNVTTVGYLLGRERQAGEVRARFEREIDDIRNRCDRAPLRGARVLGLSMPSRTYGEQTLFHDVLRLVGAVNVAAINGARTYDKISNETLLRWDADWVFTWSDPGKQAQELQRWRDDPVLSSLVAVRKQQLVVSAGKDFVSLAPQVTTLARTLAGRLCGAG